MNGRRIGEKEKRKSRLEENCLFEEGLMAMSGAKHMRILRLNYDGERKTSGTFMRADQFFRPFHA